MKTDKQLYKIFKFCPELFDAITTLDKGAGYHFDSNAFKDINRTCDGVFEPEDKNAPTYLVEFQGQKKEDVYPRAMLQMALYQLANPEREVRSLIIILTEELDPKPKNWVEFTQTCSPFYRVVYLDECIRKLSEDHPLAVTLKPLLEKDRDVLIQEASHDLKAIRKANLLPEQKDVLEGVFFSLLTQRFLEKTIEEIRKMIDFDTPVEDTVFYKEVFHIGEIKGKIEGKIEGLKDQIIRLNKELETFRDLHEQGYLPDDIYAAKAAELQAALEQLEANLAELTRQAKSQQ